MNKDVIKHLVTMRHSPLYNYIVPGLTSWLIMDNGKAGKIRLFECTREQQEFITPHSHRFDFSACVVQGEVENTLWLQAETIKSDLYMVTHNTYLGSPGQYESMQFGVQRFVTDPITHKEGDWYSMSCHDVHSIKFSRNSLVLFFEGAERTETTRVLEPCINGEHVPTMKIEPWMFRKGQA